MFNILVVEDDRELRELFSNTLQENGYNIFQAQNGEEALDVVYTQYIDLIISDVMMPKLSGFDLVRELRNANNSLPILIITAKSTQADKQEGFSVGTDDYLVKPVDLNEMLWRIQALLRRSQAVKDRSISIGNTILNCDDLSVKTTSKKIELPQKEFFLLYKLVSFCGKIFTRRQIFDEIWGYDSEAEEHTLEVHINRLREKFKDNDDFEIITIRGLGYKVVNKHDEN